MVDSHRVTPQRRNLQTQDINDVSSPGSVSSEERIVWKRVETFLNQLKNGLVIMDEESCERYFYGSRDYYNWLTAIRMFEDNLEFVINTEEKKRVGTRRRKENRRRKNERRKREMHKIDEAGRDQYSGEKHSIFNPKCYTKNNTEEITHCNDNSHHWENQSNESNDVSHRVTVHSDNYDRNVEGIGEEEEGLRKDGNHASVEVESNKEKHPNVVVHHEVYEKESKIGKLDEDFQHSNDQCDNMGVHERKRQDTRQKRYPLEF